MSLLALSSASAIDRNYTIAATGDDGQLWIRRYNYGWDDWENLSRPTVGLDGPVAVYPTLTDPNFNLYYYYARGKDGAIYTVSRGFAWEFIDGR